MTRAHIEAWRDYLVEQMHERSGIANHEAQKKVERWLRSMGRPVLKAVHIRNQREASRIRSARAEPRASIQGLRAGRN
jgi:hypothetical protein